MLYTRAQSPQVSVSVDGLDALCVNMNCDFAYVASSGSVETQSIDGMTLTLTGTGLPTENINIYFAETTCDTSTITSDGSTVSCTLAEVPAGGSFTATLVDTYGAIPMAEAP